MVRLVVMAAGKATRMGQDKLALPWQGSTVLGSVVETILFAERLLAEQWSKQVVDVVVVARQVPEHYLPSSLLDSFRRAGGKWIHLATYQPLSSIIQLGLPMPNTPIIGVGFVPGDQVGITVPVLAAMVEEFLRTSPDFLVPVAKGTPGSPVFFHDRYIQALGQLSGEQGGRQVLQQFRERWTLFPVDADFLVDVDTPEEYLRLRNNKQ